jgi:Phage protein
MRITRRVRRKPYQLSPEDFRELRLSCLMSRVQCAAFLRLPVATVRELRLYRLGDLGALLDAWNGWTINRNGLISPDGKVFAERTMRIWWLTSEMALYWRKLYDRKAGPRLPVQLDLF